MPEPSAPVPEAEPRPVGPSRSLDRRYSVQWLGRYGFVERTPLYLRAPFVVVTVALTVALTWVAVSYSRSGGVVERLDAAAPAVSVPEAVADVEATVTPRDCPSPSGEVDLDAARTIRLFLAATTGERFKGLEMVPEVERQIGEVGDPPPLLRATRVQGFATSGAGVSSCVRAWWFDGEQLRSSLDLVAVESYSGGWRVAGWLRGQPLPTESTRAAPLAFYNSTRSCDRPDRFASVEVPGATPDERLVNALEELLSGAPGRAGGAAVQVPADVQVVDARVEGVRATVELTATTEDLTRCQGGAAYEQVVGTAAAVVLSGLPAEPTTTGRTRSRSTPSVEVEVEVDGEVVTSLRP